MSRRARPALLPARRGDEAELFRRHHSDLVRFVQARVGVSREAAEDAVSIAWLQLIRRQPGRDRIVGWLYTVAKHEALRLRRRRARETGDIDLSEVAAAIDLDSTLEARAALRLLDRLKPQQQLVIRLRIQGLSYREICELTGRTWTWVNRHIAEGRDALRRLREEP